MNHRLEENAEIVESTDSMSENGSSILHLNDYCLDEILRMLPLEDLGSISNACHRLKIIAETVFSTIHKPLEVNKLIHNDKTDIENKKNIHGVFSNFGRLIAE